MKNLLVFVLAIALTLVNTTQTIARSVERNYVLAGTTVKITADENVKAVTVNINNIQNDVVKVSLEGTDGTVLFSQEISKMARYAKKFNLSQLENGSYKLVIRKNLTKTTQPFTLNDNGVQLNENERKEKFLPSIAQKGSMVDVNCLTSNYTNIYIRIFDNEGRLVFENTNYVVFQIQKRFNLSKLPAGAYVMEVEAGDDTQYSTLNL